MLKGKRIALCGYHWTGCKALELLLSEGAMVKVFTHENPPHIANLQAYASRRGVEVTTRSINKSSAAFEDLDLVCSIFYRYKISKQVIDSAKLGGINLHPSLLPEYRGCSSLTWAMVQGEKNAGFSYHYLTESFDAGNILVQEKVAIEDFDLQSTLYNRVMFQSMEYFIKAVSMALSQEEGTKQPREGSYYGRGAPHNATIDRNWSDESTERFIRAMTHPPYPPASFKGQNVTSMNQYIQLRNQST